MKVDILGMLTTCGTEDLKLYQGYHKALSEVVDVLKGRDLS